MQFIYKEDFSKNITSLVTIIQDKLISLSNNLVVFLLKHKNYFIFLHIVLVCNQCETLFRIGGQYSEFSFATSKMKMAADYGNLLTSPASQTCWFPADVFCFSCLNAKYWCRLISFYRKLSLDSLFQKFLV